jgi:flagellar hook-length control protein FliK
MAQENPASFAGPLRFMPLRNGLPPAKTLISRGFVKVPNGPALAPVAADSFVLVRNAVPRIAPIAPAEIRPQASASQRNEPTDGFTQLLNTAGSDTQADAPREQDAEPVKARPAKDDRPDRAERRDDSDRSEKSNSKADASDTDSTDRVHAKEKSKDDASSDSDGKSKDHDKDGGKDKTDASADLAAASQPEQQKPLPVNAVVAVVAAVIPASVVEGYAATGMLTPAENVSPAIGAAAAPATDAKGAAGVAAQAGLTAQAALNAAKPKAKADAAPVNADAPVDSEIAATSDDKKTSSAQPVQNGINAAFTAAAKVASAAGSQSSVQADDKKGSGGEPTLTANIASEAVTANVKTETSDGGNGHDTLEGSLAKQLAADLHLASTNQIVVPDPTRGFQVNPSVNLVAQAHVTALDSQPVPLTSAAVAIEIAARAKDGARQFDIRLDPPELGRIDVKLDVDKNGTVNTHLTVDRPETLDLLRRDSQGLERALQQAGLKTSDGGLEFSLRQQTPDGSFNDRNQAQANPAGTAVLGDNEQTATIHAEQYQWAARMRGGVDIRV